MGSLLNNRWKDDINLKEIMIGESKLISTSFKETWLIGIIWSEDIAQWIIPWSSPKFSDILLDSSSIVPCFARSRQTSVTDPFFVL